MKPPAKAKKPQSSTTLPLYNGDHMKQKEFHRRYEAYPDETRFELIEGIVYMTSPARWPHGTHTFKLGGILALYQASTPGVEGGDNVTTILGEEDEPQPDLVLRLLAEYRGQTRIDEDQYLVGAPELVIEVAYSSRSIDLHKKNQRYLAAGVQEYVVYSVEEAQIHWFHFPSKRKLKADKQGIWKSRVFPGLWIHGPALAAENLGQLIATLQEGLASPEHQTFVQKLAAIRQRKR
jgi:Uma2 family endonuclease